MAEMIIDGSKNWRRFDPRHLDKEEKKIYCDKHTVFRCTCRRDIELLYRFYYQEKRDTYALRPLHNNMASQHAPECDLNEQYNRGYERRNALGYDKDSNTIKARVYENINVPANRSAKERTYPPYKRAWDEKDQKPSTTHVINIIRAQNMEISYRQTAKSHAKDIFSFSQQVFESLKTCSASKSHFPADYCVNMNIKGKYVSNGLYERRNGSVNIGSDNGFFYSLLRDIEYTFYDKFKEKQTVTLSGEDYNIEKFLAPIKQGYKAYSPVVTLIYRNKEGDFLRQYMRITEAGLKAALSGFCKEYGATYINTEKGYYIATGYLYEMDFKNEKKWQIDRMYLFRVCDHGIFCESSYEAEAFNEIFKWVEKESRIHFYKPWRFRKNVYDGDYIEDGILLVDGCYKTGVLEVFGRANDADYEIRKAAKEKYLAENSDSYVFIPWNRADGESIEIFRSTLERAIWDISEGRIK